MIVEEKTPWQVRTTLWAVGQVEAWRDAWSILFPQPKSDISGKADNVIQMQPLSSRITQYIEMQSVTRGSRPSCREVARLFRCAPSTVSRAVARENRKISVASCNTRNSSNLVRDVNNRTTA